jgi:RsiW-degrading membrane proteinase PrsW (M82 family)
MTSHTTMSSTLLDNGSGLNLPTFFINNDDISRVRGRTIWLSFFKLIILTVSALFGYVVCASSDSDELGRGISAGIAIFACGAIFQIAVGSMQRRFESQALPVPLAVQFFIRGASVSILLAAGLEVFGMSFNRPREVEWKDIPIALTVGFAEEVSKMLMVIAGICLIPTNLPESIVPETNETCMRCIPVSGCVRAWTVLIESPIALATAGLSVGFGFMFSENLEYFYIVFTTMDVTTRLITMGLRILTNLHPILTGLAACRLASNIWLQGTPKTVSIGKVAKYQALSFMHCLISD